MNEMFHRYEIFFGEILKEALAKNCQILFPIHKPTVKADLVGLSFLASKVCQTSS